MRLFTTGTTDSTAAFIAAGISKPGQALTSLGSTLVIKTISEHPVQDSARGVYSHRLGDKCWLVGGASNVGCAVLAQEGYHELELRQLSDMINPYANSPYDYYPLTKTGERFPVCDPHKLPVLTPKPTSLPGLTGNKNFRAAYLHGLLHGIARVEKQGYEALEELGVTPVTQVLVNRYKSY